MKIADCLLFAPLVFCVAAGVAGVTTDIGFSRLCLWIMAASVASFALRWAIALASRRNRVRR